MRIRPITAIIGVALVATPFVGCGTDIGSVLTPTSMDGTWKRYWPNTGLIDYLVISGGRVTAEKPTFVSTGVPAKSSNQIAVSGSAVQIYFVSGSVLPSDPSLVWHIWTDLTLNSDGSFDGITYFSFTTQRPVTGSPVKWTRVE